MLVVTFKFRELEPSPWVQEGFASEVDAPELLSMGDVFVWPRMTIMEKSFGA